MNTPTFTIVFIGDSGVGKSTLLTRHKTGDFEKQYFPTVAFDIEYLHFITTTHGPINFNIWDVSGQERLNIKNGFAEFADAAVVMFDRTNALSWKNTPHWINLFNEMCPNKSIVVCGNKVDIKNVKVLAEDISLAKTPGNFLYGIQYYDISAKSNYNFEKPFLYLARKLIGDTSLQFVEAPAVTPLLQ